MKAALLLSFVFNWVLYSTALAAEKTSTETPHSSAAAPAVPPEEPPKSRLTAAYNPDHPFMVDAQIVSYGPNNAVEQSWIAGVFITPKILIFAEAGRGVEFIHFYSDEDLISHHYGIHYKHFLGDNFYYRLGFTYNKLQYENNDWLAASDWRAFNGRSSSIRLAVGHQWLINFVNIGVDWVGINVPLKYTVNDVQRHSGTTDSQLSDDIDRHLAKFTWSFLSIYGGFTF